MTTDSKAVVKAIAERFKSRSVTQGLTGKKRDLAALEHFVGASSALTATLGENDAITQHVLSVSMLISIRGYSIVQDLLGEGKKKAA